MKNTWKRIFSLCLSLVMVALLIPAYPAEAAEFDETNNEVVLFEIDFSKYENKSDLPISFNSNFTLDAVNGVLVVGGTNNVNGSTNVDISLPGTANSGNMTFKIKYEAVLATTDKQYHCQLKFYDADDAEITSKSNKPALTSDSAAEIGTTNGYETVSVIYQVKAADIESLRVLLGGRASSSGNVSVKSIKISLLPAEGTYTGADLLNVMKYDNAYVKLPADLTVDGNLTLGENAVLDLNGKTLTVNGIVNAAAGARILNGKLAVPAQGTLTFDQGATNGGLLPLWTNSGYIFTNPELGDERAFFVEQSANGFTMDFRPGFGTVDGKNIRETYLQDSACGITMTAQLNWIDMYGGTGNADVGCNDIFKGMYATANHRGRLTVTGAKTYQEISMSITLSSCGVTKTFATPTFENEEVAVFTTHLELASAAKGDTPNLQTAIDTSKGGKLVLEFDVSTEAGGDDDFAVRVFPDKTTYSSNGTKVPTISLFGSGGSGGSNLVDTAQGNFYKTDAHITTEAGKAVHCKIEIDMATGAWTAYADGVQLDADTYPRKAEQASAQAVLSGVTQVAFYVAGGSTHTFSNIKLYSIT